MRFADRIRAAFRRVDVRAALHLALIFAPLVSALLFVLYVFAATELLELATFGLENRRIELERAWQEQDPARRATDLESLGRELDLEAGGYRILAADGALKASGGVAPTAPGGEARANRVLDPIRIGPGERLAAAHPLAAGERIEVFVSSDAFVRERDEVFQGFVFTLVAGIVLVGLVAIPATWLSLSPLRRATRVADSLDAHSLATRIPTRGTDDDVDRHLRVVNRLLDQIARGFARLEGFSQDVAHELRTPVHRILNASELLLLDAHTDDRTQDEARTISQTAQQMARLIDGLLLLARSEQETIALRRERVDVASLCETLEEMYAPVCERASIRLEVVCQSAWLEVDPALVLRAIGNLLDNAIDHTPAGGVIRLHGALEPAVPTWIRIEVEDDGPGIPERDRERVFDRFARSESTRHGGGVGLGLPIARAIARAHAGELELGAGGGGARFVLWLPVGPEGAGVRSDGVGGQWPPRAARGRKATRQPTMKTSKTADAA
jgi:signal transduction histidine kinase